MSNQVSEREREREKGFIGRIAMALNEMFFKMYQ